MSQTIQEIIDAMTVEQQSAVYALVGAVLDENDNMEHSDIDANALCHSVIDQARRDGSLKETFLSHAADYGIDGIETLFPNAKNMTNAPVFLNNKVEWVNKVLGAVTNQPFSRIKTMFADISQESARARGYVKGERKIEDVFGLLKRTTEPFTIYKKQKLDRDDIIDITDFEVIAWIKQTLRMKLDEELARAILFGDGRVASDEHKIDETCIRPVYNDDDLYTIKVEIAPTGNKYDEFINECVRSRKLYRGSGNPTLYTTEDLVSEILLLKDNTGNRIYKTVGEIEAVLRVKEIVTINEMANLVRTDDDGVEHEVLGLFVNLSDYAVGTDRGGAVSMFDDFDIDFNQQKYLIETRCSGSLIVPYSAISIEKAKTVSTLMDVNDEGGIDKELNEEDGQNG